MNILKCKDGHIRFTTTKEERYIYRTERHSELVSDNLIDLMFWDDLYIAYVDDRLYIIDTNTSLTYDINGFYYVSNFTKSWWFTDLLQDGVSVVYPMNIDESMEIINKWCEE